jgi:hypothetical protein
VSRVPECHTCPVNILVTDDDRQLLLELRRMTDACGAFCAGVIKNDLSRDDQLALSDWLADLAGRIRKKRVVLLLSSKESLHDQRWRRARANCHRLGIP